MIQKNSRNPDVSCINLKGRQSKEVDLSSMLNSNGNIQNEINEKNKNASQSSHLVKGLL